MNGPNCKVYQACLLRPKIKKSPHANVVDLIIIGDMFRIVPIFFSACTSCFKNTQSQFINFQWPFRLGQNNLETSFLLVSANGGTRAMVVIPSGNLP